MIRKLKIEDIKQVQELGNLLSPNFSKTNNLEEMENNPYTKVLVYEEEETIKGFLMYTELEETTDIVDIIVKEEERQKGVASCLMDYMLSDLKESVKLLTLEVRKSNTPAIALYEKFGFEVVNIREKYYGDGEDAYLMGRRIRG